MQLSSKNFDYQIQNAATCCEMALYHWGNLRLFHVPRGLQQRQNFQRVCGNILTRLLQPPQKLENNVVGQPLE